MAEYDILTEQRGLLQQWAHGMMAGEEAGLEDDPEADGAAAPPGRPGRGPAGPPAPTAATKDWDGIAMAACQGLCYKVQRSRPEVYALVTTALERCPQWQEVSSPTWNFLWTWRKPRFSQKMLLAWQRMNHYPNSMHLTRKDLLKKHLTRYSRLPGKTGDAFHIMPMTFSLPSEYVAFAEEFARDQDAGRPNLWIMKPVGMSRGRGIELVGDIQDVTYGVNNVIQKYVDRPLLIDGYKFDLRLYVVVTSFSPLEAFLYRKGFARFTSVKYTPDKAHISNKHMHLTNTALQQDHPCPSRLCSAQGINKCELQELCAMLSHMGIEWASVWVRIMDLILKSLCCTEDAVGNVPTAFELFGYDVLLDADLRPWLLEVNASPSMEVDNALDEEVKTSLISDTLHLVDPLPFDRHQLARVLDRRIAEYTKPQRSRLHESCSRTEQRQQLWQDLHHILGGRVPRAYGEDPKCMAQFERIAPSANYGKYCKLKRI